MSDERIKAAMAAYKEERERQSARSTTINIRPCVEAALAAADAQLYALICKAGSPINLLIGAAQSAEGITQHGVTKMWEESLLERAEAAAKAWDELLELLTNFAKPS